MIDKNQSNEASSARVDEVNKTNVVTVESKDYRIDMVAKSAESQDDNGTRSKRDEASGAKIDGVDEKEDGEFPQVCDSKADDRGPPQRQKQQLSTAAVHVSEDDAARSTQHRTNELVVDVPDETEPVQRLDLGPLDVTQKVVQAKAAPAQEGASHVPCDLTWRESRSRRKPHAVTGVPALYLQTAS